MTLRAPLTLWTSFVLAFAGLSYSARFTEGPPDDDVLYRWSTVAAGLLQFAIVGFRNAWSAYADAVSNLAPRMTMPASVSFTTWTSMSGS